MTAAAATYAPGPLDPGRCTGLLTTRDFLTPAVERAVASLRLPAGAWVLDAGTGSGVAVPALARAVGAAGSVRAIDTDPSVIPLATAHAAGHGMAGRVRVERADVVDVVAHAATEPGHGFDALWAADVVGPENFADPAAAVAAMALALRPGGVLALFTCRPGEAVYLPGHARLERLLRAAAARHDDLAADGHHHHDRYLSWLHAAGLENLGLAAFPRIGIRIETDRPARAHLTGTVWPRMWAAAAACGAQVGMTVADIDELHALTRPGPRYVLDDPGYHVLHPTVLATGRRGRAGRR